MIAVLQRVSGASVTINEETRGSIQDGLMILLGIGREDTEDDIPWLSKKIVNMRIFSDEEGKMNQSVKDINGEILLISQFTLHASIKKGNRPSFIYAADPDQAVPLYEKVKEQLEADLGKEVQTGEFGAEMRVSLTNEGPVTIIADTQNKT